jgi:transposase-like protein
MSARYRRYRLSVLVEVDEGYVGGKEHGERQCGRGVGTKSLGAVAVERRGPGKSDNNPIAGFAALDSRLWKWFPMRQPKRSQKFLADKVKPGSHILSDGRAGYRRLRQKGFERTATAISKQEEPAHVLFAWAHIALSNLKRFLLGAHHKMKRKHLPYYVAEFNYRLNRRTMEPDLMSRLPRACISAQTIT